MSINAMKQALEALEQTKPLYSHHDAKAILRQAIAEAEKHEVSQEPVACLVETEQAVMLWPIEDIAEAETYCDTEEFPTLLYTHPPKREWLGLTDEEIDQGQKESWVTKQAWESAVWWAEAKLKEKNA